LRISNKRAKFNNNNLSRRYRTNNFIRVPEVRLIDEDGQNLGVMPTSQALALAQERGLDMIEVSPLAQPPVVKIANFSKLKYQAEKERRKEKAKQKKIEIKGIRLSLRISEHDIDVRVHQAAKFLGVDDKVKIEMLLRGREMQHANLAYEIIKKFVEAVNQLIPTIIEQPLGRQGSKISVVIAKQ
jgi:translation initiation factor IF-3